jgi:hypothetical protein
MQLLLIECGMNLKLRLAKIYDMLKPAFVFDGRNLLNAQKNERNRISLSRN